MYDFTYHRPNDLAEAGRLYATLEEAKLLAGGHTLLPTMKQRLAAPAHLIDLAGIPGLRDIRDSPSGIEIGAMARHAEVAASALVRRDLPGLAALASMIGDPLVRHRGTIGGSISNNDPAADYPAGCLALHAEIVTSQRSIPAEAFFCGLFETALEPGEIVLSVRFPRLRRAGYVKFKSQASRYALVGVFVAQHGEGEVCVAVTGAGANGVFRWREAEALLEARFSPDVLDGAELTEPVNEDAQADAAYRRHLVAVIARRAVEAVCSGQSGPQGHR